MTKSFCVLSVVIFSSLFVTLSAQQRFPDLVEGPEAVSLLQSVLPALQADVEATTEGTTEFVDAQRKFAMYQHVYEFTIAGSTTSEALDAALGQFPNTVGRVVHADELSAEAYTKNGGYGDAIFDGLVDFLTL